MPTAPVVPATATAAATAEVAAGLATALNCAPARSRTQQQAEAYKLLTALGIDQHPALTLVHAPNLDAVLAHALDHHDLLVHGYPVTPADLLARLQPALAELGP